MPTTAVDTYALTPDQVDFRDTIRQIVRERVAPRAAEIDAKAEYPWDLRKLFAEQDLLGLPFEEAYGGTGTGALMLSVAIEEIARACASTALILMLQDLGTLPIKLFGSEELKQRFLPKCASGEWSPAFALSEPEAGSDPGGMITKAVKDGDEWVVTGTKNWISNLGIADFYIVFAKTDPSAPRSRGISAFVVEADRPGFCVGKLEHKLGIKGSPTGQPIFDDVRIPAANLIGDGGQGHERRARHARPLAARRRRPGRRHRPGRDRPRRRLRQRAPAVRPGDLRVPGHPVQARRHGDAHGRRARAALPRVREDRPPRARRAASTRRWPSCSPPTRRWR